MCLVEKNWDVWRLRRHLAQDFPHQICVSTVFTIGILDGHRHSLQGCGVDCDSLIDKSIPPFIVAFVDKNALTLTKDNMRAVC